MPTHCFLKGCSNMLTPKKEQEFLLCSAHPWGGPLRPKRPSRESRPRKSPGGPAARPAIFHHVVPPYVNRPCQARAAPETSELETPNRSRKRQYAPNRGRRWNQRSSIFPTRAAADDESFLRRPPCQQVGRCSARSWREWASTPRRGVHLDWLYTTPPSETGECPGKA